MRTQVRNRARGMGGRQGFRSRRGATMAGRSLPMSGVRIRRSKPRRSMPAKAIENVGGRLPGSRGKGKRRGAIGKAAIAVAAGVAGLAFKRRRKLRGKRSEHDAAVSDKALQEEGMTPSAVGMAPVAPDVDPENLDDQAASEDRPSSST